MQKIEHKWENQRPNENMYRCKNNMKTNFEIANTTGKHKTANCKYKCFNTLLGQH
jgi:hypothetical protein